LERSDAQTGHALGRVLRHDYGRVLAALLREFGGTRVALIEDGLSQAMLEAMTSWRARGVPPEPRAWLHRAAKHRIVDELRRTRRLAPEEAAPEAHADAPDVGLHDDLGDDEVRALYACAHPSIPLASQLVFALRTLAAFSTKEIAMRLVTSEENVQKRFERAREAFQTIDVREELTGTALMERTDAVLRMIYVLFTEGYLPSSGARALRLELCHEAIRLAGWVAAHRSIAASSAEALLALMHLHHARRDARVDPEGRLVMLEDQDRSRYRHDELRHALSLLERASASGLTTKYHLEAAIVAEHAFAPAFEATDWSRIVQLYDRLAHVDPSPLHTLHAAVAASYAEGPDQGLARLETMRPPTWLLGSHLWLGAYADMHARAERLELARDYYDKAIAVAPPLERAMLIERRRARVGSQTRST